MKKGQTVNHANYGEGILLEITDKIYVVDFNGNIKRLMITFTKFESVVKLQKRIEKRIAKNKENNELKLTAKYIYSSIVGTRDSRHSNWEIITKAGLILQKADELGSFVSSIIESALNGEKVTSKQAWAVAYFAENNNLINA